MPLSSAESRQLAELYRQHHQAVFRIAGRFAAGDRQWAMDRVQDVFVKLGQELGTLDTTQELGGWLYRVTVNVCLMELRRSTGWRSVVRKLMEPFALDDRSPLEAEQARRDVSRAEATIGELPAMQRMVMVLLYVEGKTTAEAGALLGISKSYVSKLHTKAMTRLRKQPWELSHA